MTVFRANTPQLYVDIDRTKCKTMGVPLSDVFDALQVDLGGLYVNDFNQFGRTWQVNAQADIPFRMQPEDMRRLQVRNAQRRDGSAGHRGDGRATAAGRSSSTATTCTPPPPSTAARARHELGRGDRRGREAGRRATLPRRWASNGPN